MIDKRPTPGDLSDELIFPYDDRQECVPIIHDTPARRQSTILGPDGEPMWIDTPRRALGFDLRPTSKGQ